MKDKDGNEQSKAKTVKQKAKRKPPTEEQKERIERKFSWTPTVGRALSLHILGRSDRQIGAILEIAPTTVLNWRNRPEWREKLAEIQRADEEWLQSERRDCMRVAILESRAMLADTKLSNGDRIRLISEIAGWGGLRVHKAELRVDASLTQRSREDLEDELQRLRGSGE